MNVKLSTEWSADKLKSLPIGERLSRCPPFLQEVISKSVETLRPLRVWIYGSRARGEQTTGSEYDLAFEIPKETESHWEKFVSEQRETVRTFLPIDWVLLSRVKQSLREEILSEGVLIYEEKQSK
jgi:CRISPR-associated protein Cmr1